MSWSQKIKDKFGTTLSEELHDWFDSKIWEQVFVGDYMEFIPPESLLDHESYAIWGGQMLPDMLPVATNGMGDVLAAHWQGRRGSRSERVESRGWILFTVGHDFLRGFIV